MKKILLLFFTICILSCKDEPLSNYIGKDAISFYFNHGTESDKVIYSFKYHMIPIQQDTVWLNMRLVGKLSDQPRKISVIAVVGSTAVDGVHYKIIEDVVLPPNQYLVKYPVVVLNAEGLDKNSVELTLDVAENEDLAAAADGWVGKEGTNTRRYHIEINNKLVKPSYWDIRKNYVGNYSEVKYQFIIGVIGTHDFGNYAYADLVNFKAKIKNALQEYETNNGPLIDELGQVVTFPM